ncbi:hypothetical protein BO86DRAFT_435685 [Aspergillus japonicus CBS 114.51]|uniref:Uncharacterized protein n=2 Tax=Aspergillus TaxID=5052 RepID=A0A2V5H4P1_ASPV1|nr:hypothetical protein BO86DRAFT_435685 [Aspergillus japonicus CBS 114.51]PYI16574.1 hypothetical protein BO99DRAFT_483762 [Aspergillus violaceofuscus CBS 115571]RAH79621.1 hypothetical protein BO86DRAFT_435685 [Aspergillus japonicus CBS 114.51]
MADNSTVSTRPVFPNIPARTDQWYHRLRDRLHLASIGVLGPEFLLMLALGQWSSARASVKKFEQLARDFPNSNRPSWTLAHAFYADMGGFILEEEGNATFFPVNAEQLYFLIANNYIKHPPLTEEEINDRNKSDSFSRVLAVSQALWFLVNSALRVAQGLFLTTLELTTISYVVVFLVTSFCWRAKPSGITGTMPVKTETPIETIRAEHCLFPDQRWHGTPLDFVHADISFCGVHWRYYTQILRNIHLPVFSRPMTAQPQNRIISDNFPVTDLRADCIATPVLLLFGSMFLIAWDFHYPTRAERLLWRIASAYNLLFTVVGGLHAGYCDKILLPRAYVERRQRIPWIASPSPSPSSRGSQMESCPSSCSPPLKSSSQGFWTRLAGRLRNIDPTHDPKAELPLRVLVPTSVICALYCVGRAYILVEDFIALRSLPASAFQTVSWEDYVPHL